jgi:hypothetical protein
MNTSYYTIATLLFMLLVITLFCLLIYGLHYALQKVAWAQGRKKRVFLYMQSFRVLMELILWLAFLDNIIPIQMTFEGLNYDILVGLTAPVVAYFCFTRKIWPRSVAIVWNFFGLGLLLNIVVISVLSAPVPFRMFMNEPANTFVAGVPFVWLPAFVVPMAYWMHILSIKQLIADRKTNFA